jgi:hypothetical protein
MVKLMSSSNTLFITGCDQSTRWMLPWFTQNFKIYNPDSELKVYDFDTFAPDLAGWFKKPTAMIDASKQSSNVCWIDTDCHVLSNLEDIFSFVEPNKIAMVEDVPWSRRRNEKWHNSGVVAFNRRPNILDAWEAAIKANPQVGDQEVLHEVVRGGLRRTIHITDLPREYNTLRLDLLDGTSPANPKIMHWTGKKGKDEIRKMTDE